jgi:hypothetical protein
MIELQDDGIALAALDAGMLLQILGDKRETRIALKRIVPLISLKVCLLIILIVLLGNLPAALAAT